MQSQTIKLWGFSGSPPAVRLRPGFDLVLQVRQGDGFLLANGVAVDDYLGSAARVAVDRESRRLYRAWRERWAPVLTVEGVDLAHIWEVELIAQCFLPAAHLLAALPLALAAVDAQRVVLRPLDAGTTQLAIAVAESEGIDVVTDSAVDEGPGPALRKAPSRLGSAALRLGVPAHVRGEVVGLNYWNTQLVFDELARRPRAPRVVAAPLPMRDSESSLWRWVVRQGGWIGMPGPLARSSSRAAVRAALQRDRWELIDPTEAAVDIRACEILERLSLDTLAHVRHARRALSRSPVRAAVVPFDSPEQARMLLLPLREIGASSLLVQHGFPARLGDPDMQLADHLALWSEHDRSLVVDRDPATSSVTGNPGAHHLLGIKQRRRSGYSVVLVDYPGRLSSRVDSRISARHVAIALEALASVRQMSAVVIRPHPGDLAPGDYEMLAAAYPQLRAEIDVRSPIEDLLTGAGLCVGALSTATLQACALYVPTVFLDTSGVARPWPFDGSAFPLAFDVETLAEAICSSSNVSEIIGREAAVEALGVRADAVDRVSDLILDLVH